MLEGLEPTRGNLDEYVWPLDRMEGFVVKTYYAKMLSKTGFLAAELASRDVIKVVWKAKMPSKVKIFMWRLLKDKLPTRFQLSKRNIIVNQDQCRCVFGCPIGEDLYHLFLSCDMLKEVWRRIKVWLKIIVDEGANCNEAFMLWFVALKRKIPVKRAGVIWQLYVGAYGNKEMT